MYSCFYNLNHIIKNIFKDIQKHQMDSDSHYITKQRSSGKDKKNPNKKGAKNEKRKKHRKVKKEPVVERVSLIANARANRILNDKARRMDRVKKIIQTNNYEKTLDEYHQTFIDLEDEELRAEYNKMMNSNGYDEYPEVNYMSFEEIPV